jgi:hypothetical protein
MALSAGAAPRIDTCCGTRCGHRGNRGGHGHPGAALDTATGKCYVISVPRKLFDTMHTGRVPVACAVVVACRPQE